MREVIASVKVTLDDRTLQDLFENELERLAEDMYVVDKPESRPGIYKILYTQGHGSDVDELVTKDVNDPKYSVQVAASRLRRALRQAKL